MQVVTTGVPADAPKIVQPVVDGFFEHVELPASCIAKFQRKLASEHFALGDQFDLLTGASNPITITLTTLVGTEGDEQVGNDSYIGALATVERPMDIYMTQGYYAVRRHKPAAKTTALGARLAAEPLPFSVQSRIVALLPQRMKPLTTPGEWAPLQDISPRVSVQSSTSWISGMAEPDRSLTGMAEKAACYGWSSIAME